MIAIISILSVIGIPQYTQYKIRAYDAHSKQALHDMHLLCNAYWLDTDSTQGCDLPKIKEATYGFNQNTGLVVTLSPSPLDNFCAFAKHISSPNTYSIDSTSLISSGGTCSGAGGSVQTPFPVGKYGRCARSAGIHQAVRAINPSAQVSVNAGDLDQMTWHGGTEVISKSDIQAKQAEMNAICAADPTTPKVGMTRMEQNIAKAGYFDKLYAGRKLISDERKAEIATCAVGPRSEWTC